MPRVRWLYLHGFASSPTSKKGLAFDAHFAARGVTIQRLDLRVPSLEHLRLTAMMEVVAAAIGEDERAVLIGSSLGGLTAARVAERDPRVIALVLLAPAFRLVERWRDQLGPAAWEAWRHTGWREIHDHATGRPARLDHGFVEDVERIDVGMPRLDVPALIVHGVQDDAVPVEHSRAFAAAHPERVTLVEVEDGHELVASLPRVLAESDAFFTRLSLAGGDVRTDQRQKK